MDSENANRENAKEKLKHLVEDIKVAMMVTGLHKESFSAVPMSTKKVDEDGTIWFLSLKNSAHNLNISGDNKVQLLYSNPLEMEFVSISGTGTIITDQSVFEALYNKKKDPWFKGIDDPDMTAIKFTPSNADYWDAHANKYKELYRLGIAAINGNNEGTSESGRLEF